MPAITSHSRLSVTARHHLTALAAFGCLLVLAGGILLPIVTLLRYSLQDSNGQFNGITNLLQLLRTPGLVSALEHSLAISALVTLLSVTLAYLIAYGLTKTRLAGRALLQLSLQLPLCVPSILPCLGLMYLFGGQGVFSDYIDIPLYGPLGVTLGGVLFTLPHAVLLLCTTLRAIDPRLYQAAEMLGAGNGRQFFTITLPNSLYGIISASFVVFTLTMTDFGIAKVLAGQYNLLATEIYQQIIGLHNFPMGAALSLLLLLPMLLAFIVDNWARKKQARLSGVFDSALPEKSLLRDSLFTLLCWLPTLVIVSVIGVVVWGSFINYWPYDFTLTLDNYRFAALGYSWQPYLNSLQFAFSVALCGSLFCFIVAYLAQRAAIWPPLKTGLRLLSLLPLSVPGTVLGLAYLLTFSSVSVWTNGMLILVINTVIHLFSVPFLSSSTTLLQINPCYEAAGTVSGVNRGITFYKVIVPLSQSTLVDTFFYLFTNALTTVSAVIFLYGPNTMLASIAVLNMDDAGDLAAASAMGSVLLLTALSARAVYRLLVRLQQPRGITMSTPSQVTADINTSPLKIASPLH